MTIPLEQGFTVVTGPNGSGKSNILDAVLFCLGLASSRGMRAERLPDLINSAVLKSGRAAETVVSVRFDLSDWQPDEAEAGLEAPAEGPWIKPGQSEWTVSRKLRVAPGGTYASSFSADGEPCNLQQILQLQGDRRDRFAGVLGDHLGDLIEAASGGLQGLTRHLGPLALNRGNQGLKALTELLLGSSRRSSGVRIHRGPGGKGSSHGPALVHTS